MLLCVSYDLSETIFTSSDVPRARTLFLKQVRLFHKVYRQQAKIKLKLLCDTCREREW